MKNEHFGAALRERRAKRTAQESSDPKPIDMKQYERSLNCPSCHKRMEAHPYYGPGNVVIDSCERCSYVWLDHGELTRLEQASGGRAVPTPPVYIDKSLDSVPAILRSSEDSWPLQALADLFL